MLPAQRTGKVIKCQGEVKLHFPHFLPCFLALAVLFVLPWEMGTGSCCLGAFQRFWIWDGASLGLLLGHFRVPATGQEPPGPAWLKDRSNVFTPGAGPAPQRPKSVRVPLGMHPMCPRPLARLGVWVTAPEAVTAALLALPHLSCRCRARWPRQEHRQVFPVPPEPPGAASGGRHPGTGKSSGRIPASPCLAFTLSPGAGINHCPAAGAGGSVPVPVPVPPGCARPGWAAPLEGAAPGAGGKKGFGVPWEQAGGAGREYRGLACSRGGGEWQKLENLV